MELSPEDTLRLNVLLANKPQAIRIHESRMIVYGLSEKGEAQVQLNPTCRDDQYLKLVKELLSGHVLGSPGGYPIYLQRWTRMGQMRDESLEQLLLLGEPEAVVAAVCAPGLTDELARRAWWAMEDAESARQMLTKAEVVAGEMGLVLASYLVEHLPFETEPEKMIESVSLALQPGLISDQERDDLWKKSQRRNAYYVGFLATANFPEMLPAHPQFETLAPTLEALADAGNGAAALLSHLLSGAGQTYLDTLQRIFKKPSNQDVINISLDLVARYFSAARPEGLVDMTLDELIDDADRWLADPDSPAASLLAIDAGLAPMLRAMRVLSGLSYGIVRPVFRDSTAIGSLMRRKLEPIITPLMAEVAQLQG